MRGILYAPVPSSMPSVFRRMKRRRLVRNLRLASSPAGKGFPVSVMQITVPPVAGESTSFWPFPPAAGDASGGASAAFESFFEATAAAEGPIVGAFSRSSTPFRSGLVASVFFSTIACFLVARATSSSDDDENSGSGSATLEGPWPSSPPPLSSITTTSSSLESSGKSFDDFFSMSCTSRIFCNFRFLICPGVLNATYFSIVCRWS
mmetsp:Transcript_8952/g.30829  ORF Transcript_8952/g.30829 Transcript_8952/m.30829 type:complete len:206 (-) Transcript_8952:1270-1887(-)